MEAELDSDGTLHVQLELALKELEEQAWGREKNITKLMVLYKDAIKRGKVDRRRIPKKYMAGVEFEIFPYLQIDSRYSDAGCGWNWDGGYLGLVGEVSAEITRQMVAVVGPVPVPWYLKASLSVALQGELGVKGMTDQSARLAGELTVNPQARGAIGAGVDSLIALECWVSGGLTEGFRFDGSPIPIVADLTLSGGARAYAFMFECEFGSLEWTCDLLAGDCTGPGLNAAAAAPSVGIAESATAARLIPRAYLKAPDYGSFPAAAASSVRAAIAGAAAAPTQTAAVQQVVFPQSQATLSAAGGRLQAAWLYDEPSRLAINRSVAVFSDWQGSAWGPYAPIADDGTADFHPRLLTFADGATVAAWEDVKTVLADTATFEEMVAALEIRVGVRNAQTGQWQTQRLTNNAYLDRSPRVAGVPGDLWVVWIENQGNNVRGTPASPNALKAVHWNGTAWGAAQTLASFGEGLVRYELAYNGTSGALVMNLDLDGDSGTVDDQELYAIRFSGGNWGPCSA